MEKFLEGKKVSEEELKKLREELPKDKKLIEVAPNHYKVLGRIRS